MKRRRVSAGETQTDGRPWCEVEVPFAVGSGPGEDQFLRWLYAERRQRGIRDASLVRRLLAAERGSLVEFPVFSRRSASVPVHAITTNWSPVSLRRMLVREGPEKLV